MKELKIYDMYAVRGITYNKIAEFCKNGEKWPTTAILVSAVKNYKDITFDEAEGIVAKFEEVKYDEATADEDYKISKLVHDAVEIFLSGDREKIIAEIEKAMENKVKKTLEEKGDEWVIAALVDGSIGYHTPTHAKSLIKRFKEGKKQDFCERCLALYNAMLDIMMYSDILRFEYIERKRPDDIKKKVEVIKQIAKLDCEKQMMISLAYPTMGF